MTEAGFLPGAPERDAPLIRTGRSGRGTGGTGGTGGGRDPGDPGAHGRTGPGGGVERARRFMVLATMLYRGSHLVLGLAIVAEHQRDRPACWAVLGSAAVCGALQHGGALRRGWFVPWTVVLDVTVTGCVLPCTAVTLWGDARRPVETAWVLVLGGSVSAVAAVGLRRPLGPVAVGAVCAAQFSACLEVQAGPAAAGLCLDTVSSSAVLAWLCWRYLCRQGRLLDAANARALHEAAQRARYAERIAHHRALHDTVLATLTAIASGGIDANTPEVRRRCAREAAYLRRLVQQPVPEIPDPVADAPAGGAYDLSGVGGSDSGAGAGGTGDAAGTDSGAGTGAGPGGGTGPAGTEQAGTEQAATEQAGGHGPGLPAALERAVRGAESLGLRVTTQYHDLPALPPHAAAAVAGAVEEALNNVRRHAGTGHAFLTATGRAGRLTVTVVDRGRGFDPYRTAEGLGLSRSVRARMREAGGRAEVDSAPGEGVRVALRWPA